VTKVFISYAHPSELTQKRELLDRVLALADSLRRNGIDAIIDQYEVSPSEGWPRWMQTQVTEADFVLIVCTEEYNRRFQGNEAHSTGRGATWESGIIIQELYDAQGQNSKFIPIILCVDDSDFIPTPLRGVSRYELTEFRLDTDNGYTDLYRHLTNQPDTPLTPLGSIVNLAPQRRQTDFQALRVFISYAHPSELNQKRALLDQVLTLSERLRLDGIDCYIDRYLENIPENWTEWAQEQLAKANFVLVVCTKEYHHRFRSSESYQQGLAWQGSVVIDQLHADQNSKFIAINFSAEDSKYIPAPLKNIFNEVEKPESYEALYRYLTDQPLPQTLHRLTSLASQCSRQNFLSEQIYTNTLPERGKCSLIGRNKEITQLIKRISPSNTQIIHRIQGVGGVGKTSLAIEVSHQCLEARKSNEFIPGIPLFDAFIFISFKDEPYPTFNTFKPLAERAKMPLDIHSIICTALGEKRIDKLPPEQLSQTSYEALSKQPTLLIVDNMETLNDDEDQEILNFLNGVPQSTKVIITTREGNISPSIALAGLEQKDTIDAIEEESKLRGINVSEKEMLEIHSSTGGNLFVIKDILNQKERRGDIEEILSSESGAVEQSLEKCLGKQINSLKSQNKLSYKILIALIMLNGLSGKDLLLEVAGPAVANQRKSDYSRALLELEQFCFIVKQENNCYSIEPTTREYIQRQWNEIEPDMIDAMERRKLDYYLKLTDKHGGEDKGNWKEQYEPLKREWDNIKQVLQKYKTQGDWTKLVRMWENIDRYADLNVYWQERLDWWTIIKENVTDNPRITTQALAEKAWSKILIGNNSEDYDTARKWLESAQKQYRFIGDELIKANIANYSAIAWESYNKETSKYWLEQESVIIENNSLEIADATRIRYRARNLYFRAAIEDNQDTAEQQFRKVIKLCKQIDWRRFSNYARNNLADILVTKNIDSLQEAEDLLMKGLKFSIEMEEERRIALYHFSLAKLYWRKLELYEPQSETDIRNSEYRINLDKNTNEAKTRFERLGMIPELGKIEEFTARIHQ
jgi:SEFIR domain/TIR domain